MHDVLCHLITIRTMTSFFLVIRRLGRICRPKNFMSQEERTEKGCSSLFTIQIHIAWHFILRSTAPYGPGKPAMKHQIASTRWNFGNTRWHRSILQHPVHYFPTEQSMGQNTGP